MFEDAIGQFRGDVIKIFIDKRIYLHDSGIVEIEEENGTVASKAFQNSAIIGFAR